MSKHEARTNSQGQHKVESLKGIIHKRPQSLLCDIRRLISVPQINTTICVETMLSTLSSVHEYLQKKNHPPTVSLL